MTEMPRHNTSDSPESTRHLPFYDLLSQGLLIAAFERLMRFGEKKMLWELTDRLKQLRQNYLYMIDYALSGAPDANRNKIKNDIVAGLGRIYESMRRGSEMQRGKSIYFSTARALQSTSIGELVARYRALASKFNQFESLASGTSDRSELEGVERDLFNAIWTDGLLTADSAGEISALLSDSVTSREMRSLIVGALLLGELSYHDDRRLMLLASCYADDPDEGVRMMALASLTLALSVNRRCTFGNEFRARLDSLADSPSWHDDLQSATLEFVRTLDTKRVTEDMQNYFRESFSKIGDEVRKSMKDLEKIEDLSSLDENPEWMEMLDRTGLSDKMRELSDIQEEGGDVFLQPFMQLKRAPFFYEVANWFLPFSTSRSEVVKIDNEGMLAEMVAQTPFLCDNDKYSFILAMSGIPADQRQLMLSQLEAGNMGAAQEAAASLSLDKDRRRLVLRRQIQNLYRFFTLFRSASDFNNPFVSEVNLTDCPLLIKSLKEHGDNAVSETVGLVAEFYFKHRYYGHALQAFLSLEEMTIPSAQLFQKIGYCYQKTGNLDKALDYYEQAELLDSRSEWTLRRIAALLTALGREKSALDYYRRLLADHSEDVALLNAAARCYLATGQIDEALKLWYKVDYLDNGNPQALRGIALGLLTNGDLEKSRGYYNRIAELSDLSPVDCINLGHLALIDGRGKDAIDYYSSSIHDDESFAKVVGTITLDAPLLARYGIDDDRLQLLTEALSWRNQQLAK